MESEVSIRKCLKCLKCHYCNVKTDIDSHGNIHSEVFCNKRYIYTFNRTIYSERYRRENHIYKRIDEEENPSVKNCKEFMLKSHELTEYF